MALQFFPTAEGYVKNTAGVYSYVFNYTDHLGNVRLSYGLNDNVLTIFEENNYYPFGLKHKGYNEYTPTSNKYKYNGKELQDELGLNMYDYGARNYDPTIGRWMNIDPLVEEGRRWSPYCYVMDNPVYFIDPDGMLSKSFEDKLLSSKSGTTWTNNNDGTFTSDDGETSSDEVDQQDPKSKTQIRQITPEQREKIEEYLADLEYEQELNNLGLEVVTYDNRWVALGHMLEFSMPTARFNGLFSAFSKSGNLIPKGKLANHLFKGVGKLLDTPANRKLITEISNGVGLGKDVYGKSWYAKTLRNGQQIYTYTQNGIVKGAGINKTPVDIVARYGLK